MGERPRNSHGKISFRALAQVIATKWRSISEQDKADCQAIADLDCLRYKQQMNEYKATQKYLKYLEKQQRILQGDDDLMTTEAIESVVTDELVIEESHEELQVTNVPSIQEEEVTKSVVPEVPMMGTNHTMMATSERPLFDGLYNWDYFDLEPTPIAPTFSHVVTAPTSSINRSSPQQQVYNNNEAVNDMFMPIGWNPMARPPVNLNDVSELSNHLDAQSQDLLIHQ